MVFVTTNKVFIADYTLVKSTMVKIVNLLVKGGIL